MVALESIYCDLIAAFKLSTKMPKFKQNSPIDVNPENIYSPRMIAKRTGVSVETQVKFVVSIKKLNAFEFVHDLTHFEVAQTRFKREITESQFKNYFARPPTKYRNALLFTYAEALFFAGFRFSVKLPTEIVLPDKLR